MLGGNAFIPALGGLRGIAAMSVVVSHLALHGFIPAAPFYGAGAVGVMLFFVLSGFLMTHFYLGIEATPRSALTFACARFARVYPLYAIVIVASGLLTATGANLLYPLRLEQVWTHLVLIEGERVFWTISVEFQFYALFALFWIATRRAWRCGDATVAALLVAVFLLLWWLGAPGDRILITRNGQLFIVGMLAALAVKHIAIQPALARPLLAIAIGLPFFAWSVTMTLYGTDQEPVYRSVPLQLALGLLVWAAVAAQGSLTARLMGSRPLLALGDWSYGIYLLHMPAIWQARDAEVQFGIARPWLMVPVVAAVLVMAWLSFEFIESPIRRAITGGRKPVMA